MSNVTKEFHFPTPAEMHAIEVAARRAQVEEMLRLAGAAANGVKALLARAASAVARLGRRRASRVARHGA